ncbi:MAG: AsmA family protein [Alphaproteobacteria bacterium]
MKKVLIGLLVVVVLLVVGTVAIPYVVPTDWIKDEVGARVSASTGRDLRIEGPVTLSVFPSVTVTLSDIVLANAPGAAAAQMVALGQLDLDVALLPLLGGEVDVNRFILREPVIALEVDAAGQPNWIFQTGDDGDAGASGDDAAEGGGFLLTDLKLGEVGIVDGSISYVDRGAGQAVELANVNLTIELASLDSPLKVDGSADYRGKTVAIAVGADRPRALLTGGQTPLTLSVTADPLTVSFDGTVGAADAPTASGALSVSMPSIAALAEWLGAALPDGGLPIDSVDLAGTLSGSPSRVALDALSLQLDDLKTTGDLAVALDGTRPAVVGRLDVGRLDIDRFAPPATDGADGGGGGETAGAARWSEEPIDLGALTLVDVDLILNSDGVVFRGVEAGSTVLTILLNNGVLDVDLAETSLFGGTVAVQLGADGAAAEPKVDVGFQMSGVQAEPVLTRFAEFDRLSGATAADIAVTATGGSQKEMVEGLNGQGSVVFIDGAIKGINLGAMIRNVGSAFTDTTAGEVRQTDFAELGGTFRIVNGLLRTNDLRLLAPLFRIEGAGDVDLPPRTVDMRLEPKVVATVEGQGGAFEQSGVLVPVIVEGTFDDITWRPDFESLVTDVLRDPSAIGEQIESLGDGGEEAVRGLLDNLTGGAPATDESAPLDNLRSLFGR